MIIQKDKEMGNGGGGGATTAHLWHPPLQKLAREHFRSLDRGKQGSSILCPLELPTACLKTEEGVKRMRNWPFKTSGMNIFWCEEDRSATIKPALFLTESSFSLEKNTKQLTEHTLPLLTESLRRQLIKEAGSPNRERAMTSIIVPTSQNPYSATCAYAHSRRTFSHLPFGGGREGKSI